MSATKTNGSTVNPSLAAEAKAINAKLNSAQQAELASIQAKVAQIPEAKPARTPAQQAALDDMRAKRAAAEALAANILDNPDAATQSVNAMLSAIPSGKRLLAATFATLAVSGGIGYGINQLCNYAIGVVATYSTMAAWPILIMVLGAILALYASFKVGQYLGSYIATGQIDRDVSRAWNWVFGAKGEKVAS